MMKVTLDHEGCIGCGLCVSTCPAVFGLAADGKAEVPTDATIIRVTVDEDTVEGGEAHLEYGAVRKRYKNQVALS